MPSNAGSGWKSARGQTLVLVALAMPMLFSVVAVVVDGASMMAQRRSMQNAADASALAASQELPVTGQCTGAYTDPYPSSCQSKVLWAANHYSHDVNNGP